MAGTGQAYDLVIIGGGIAGSSLGRAMALNGAEVLIVEKEVQYRDRIRGEVLLPWGSVEAKNLGIYDILLKSGARESLHEQFFLAGEPTPPRHFPSSTPSKTCVLSFFHPDMQDALAEAAADAGAEIWRGAALKAINGGRRRSADILVDGAMRTVEARIVVGADGRESNVATQLGLKRERSPQELFSVGFQLSGDLPLEPALYFFLHGNSGRGAILIQTKPRNYRAYLFHHKDALERRLSGERDYQTVMQHFREVGVPAACLDAATPHGILASFDGAFRWIDHPAVDNCALVGDAASTTDPVWGNGLSRSLRDVRLLRDRLLSDDDWVAAADAYAQDHDNYYRPLRLAEQLKNALFFTMGAAGEARRQGVFALMEDDPTVSLDVSGRGPEFGYSEELAARLLAL